jgi:hypothetical protein
MPMIAAGVVFIAFALILCAVAIFGLLGIGQIALSDATAITRDGLARGQRAPSWSLADSTGVGRSSPPGRSLQLIVFADHSLKSFPSVIAGLRALLTDSADLEVVMLTRGPGESAAAVLDQLGLAGLPVVTGSPGLYGRYNVRVMPFVIFVDSAGLVRGSSLVNHDWQVAKLRQVAALPIDPGEVARPPRRLFRLAV